MSPNAECQDDDDGDCEQVLTPEVLPDVLRTHGRSVNSEVDSFAGEIENEGKPTLSRLYSLRMEVRELDAAIEELGAELRDAKAWEHLEEFWPFSQRLS